jgi:hypothetical protein
VTSITVGLDDESADRLAEKAAREGVAPEELAGRVLHDWLVGTAPAEDADPFAWVGAASSPRLRGASVDELLAEGFGQLPSIS